jgi:glutamine synthetase adenylyltransferase
LAEAGVLERATAHWLTNAYIGYRTVLHHLSLEGQGERVVEAAPHVETRARVVEIWRETFEPGKIPAPSR